MPAPVHLRCFRWLLAFGAALGVGVALGAKPVTPPGPGGFRLSPSATLHAEGADDIAPSPATEPQFVTAPSPLPPNLANVRFETAGVAELGDLIRLAGIAAVALVAVARRRARALAN